MSSTATPAQSGHKAPSGAHSIAGSGPSHHISASDIAVGVIIGGAFGKIDWAKAHEAARRALEALGVSIDPTAEVRTLEVAGTLGHSHFPEYTARGDFFYVSARYRGDRSQGLPGGQLVIYDAHTLKQVKSIDVDVPAGVFSHVRSRSVTVGLQPPVPH